MVRTQVSVDGGPYYGEDYKSSMTRSTLYLGNYATIV